MEAVRDEYIVAKNVTYEYKNEEGATVALDEVCIEIKRGEYVSILGHNGSGKSTFSRHLNALLLPTKGSIYVEGLLSELEDNIFDIRKRVGMVFQNPDNQMVATVVEEDVAFGPENLGVPQEEIVERVYSSLAMVNMEEFAKRAPHMLSGGQKQRVAIAGVLALHSDVIVFDEATAMLDPKGRKEVLETIDYLNKEQGKTIVTITHYMEECVSADRVIIMSQGKVLASGTPREVFYMEDILKEAGLAPPFAVGVAMKLKNKGVDIGTPLTTEELAKAVQLSTGNL